MAHSAKFNREWLSKEEYKLWLTSVEGNSTKANCKLCVKTFSLSNMGEVAVKSHASGKKHQTAVTQSQKAISVSDFFEAKSSETRQESSISYVQAADTHTGSQSTTTTQGNQVTKFTLTKHQHKAEILWAMKTVMSHFSYNAVADIADIFRAMFPDSAIAQKMNCGPTKLSYLISFGIAPYFKQQLLNELKEVQCFVISFDESLNTELHEEQMDFIVRYFYKDKVRCRYLNSEFLGHTRAEDLQEKFHEGIKDLQKKKLLQISMDGPSVNWKLYENIVKEWSENDDYPGLIDIGSCSLHIVHGAFRTGVQKTKWGVDDLLKALYNMFPNSPAKREDYTKVTESNVFPLPFCGTRWIEDRKVADRAIEIWPNIDKYVKEMLKKSKSQIPSSNSFTTLILAVQDELIIAKLQFFASTASVMMPFLQKFQGDAPLVPFIATELTVLLETLMQKFIKQTELQVASTPAKIVKLNVMDTGIYVPTDDVDVGFAARATLNKVIKENKVSKRQVVEFRKDCCTMLAAIVNKIQERSPLQYSFARKLMSLDPRLIAAEPDKVVKMFRELLTKLVDKKWRTPDQGDSAWMQYKKLVSEVKRFHKEKFAEFNFEEDRLDIFFYEVLNQQKTYEDLWCVMQLLLTLSHGQGAVERGFSVNKEVLAPNLKATSLTALRLIHDSITEGQIEIANYAITDELLTSCSHASSRYKMYLMDKSKEDQDAEKMRKRKALEEELISVKKRKTELEATAKKLADSADKKSEEAETKTDAATVKTMVIESNASRKKS